MKERRARRLENSTDGAISSRAANSGRFNDRAPGSLIWDEDTVYSRIKSVGTQDYDSPGAAAVVNASQAEVDNMDYDFRAVGSGAVNDTYTIRTAAPTLTQGTLTQYQLIDAESAASSYERVFKTSGTSSVYPSVSRSGGTDTTNTDGSHTYTFAGGSKGTAALLTIDYDRYIDYGDKQGCDAVTTYTQITLPSVVSKPANPTKITSITFTAPSNITKGQSVSLTLSNYGYNNVYDCTTWENCYKASGVTTSYVAKGAYVTGGSTGGGGSVTVSPVSTPSLVQYAIKPATVTAATVTEHNSNLTVTYKKLQTTPGSETTKTFLIAQEESYG